MELEFVKANKQAIAQYKQTEKMLQDQINKLQSQLKLVWRSLEKEHRAAKNNGEKALVAVKEKFAEKVIEQPRGKRFYLCSDDYLDFRVVASQEQPQVLEKWKTGSSWSAKIEGSDETTHYIHHYIAFKHESDAFEALRWIKSQIE